MAESKILQNGPMYDWVARHTSEVEHEVIAFRGSTLDLLRVAREQDAIRAELLAALEGLVALDVFRVDDPRDEIVAARDAIAKARAS